MFSVYVWSKLFWYYSNSSKDIQAYISSYCLTTLISNTKKIAESPRDENSQAHILANLARVNKDSRGGIHLSFLYQSLGNKNRGLNAR